MASGAGEVTGRTAVADRLVGLVLTEGSVSHRYTRSVALLSGVAATRNLADTVHHLCMLHGEYPGLVDIAAARGGNEAVEDWILHAVSAFAAERAYLARLAVAAGPIPSTPGQSESEAAIVGQRHAIEMLAESDRSGCALGASFGLAFDWGAIRPILDIAADRFGIPIAPWALPRDDETSRAATAAALAGMGIERAMWFGSQQLLVQHRGLWDLLEARAAARVTH